MSKMFVLICMLGLIQLNAQSHSELNGLYCVGDESIYFKDGKCYFFKFWSETTFRMQEEYDYQYSNRTIQFKYTGQFEQEYKDGRASKVWWRLSDERSRDKAAYIRISTMQDWLDKKYEHWASEYSNKYYDLVHKQHPAMSKAQYQECLDHDNFINYSSITSAKMHDEISILEIISNIYNDLKKSNQLKNADAAPTVAAKKTPLSTDYKVEWSDWAFIRIENQNDPNALFSFSTYLFSGKKLGVKEKLFRPKRKANIDVYMDGELFHNGKFIGRFSHDGRGNVAAPRSYSLTQSMWHGIGGTMHHEQREDPNGPVYTATKWKDLSDGNYEIKLHINEKDGAIRDKTFTFKIENAKIIGDSSISTKAFKKQHGIKRFDGEFVFLSAS